MPPSADSISLYAPSIRSTYSAWSSVGLTIGTFSLDAATKPLIQLMLHQQASKNIAGHRGVPLTQESARSLVEYLSYRDTSNRTRSKVMREFFGRVDAGEDLRVIADAFEWCLGNLFLLRCSADDLRAHDILEHLSKHHSLSTICELFTESRYRAIPEHLSIPEPRVNDFGEGVWRKMVLHPTYLRRVSIHGEFVELQIWGPSFQYTPGQWLLLQVPEVSRWKWHPFTIASSPHDPYISVCVRVYKKDVWICALDERLRASLSDVASPTETTGNVGAFPEEVPPADIKRLPEIRIYGPFGRFAEDVFRLEFAVLIGYSFAVAPFISIVKDLCHRRRMGTPDALRRLDFFWIVRDFSSLSLFLGVLSEIENEVVAARLHDLLHLNIYLVQKIDEGTVWNIAVNSLDAERDPITHLRTFTTFGRPDWKSIYAKISSEIQVAHSTTKRKIVKTYFYGPELAAERLKDVTVSHTNDDIKFTFQKAAGADIYFSPLVRSLLFE